MAEPRNNNISMPPVSFHQRTHGQNIRLEKNGSTAARYASFDNGVTFTSRPIKLNERIHMEIVDVDESGQWLGSLAIGFTQVDPGSIQKSDLCKSALPNLCQKDGTSYIKRIFEKLTKQIIISFYYNQDGGFYILDGRQQELCSNIDVSKPLWGVVDIYGNVKGITFTTAPKIVDGSKAFFTKYQQKPDQLPITHFTHLKSLNVQPVAFRHVHGAELELFCQNKVAFRKNVQILARPYVFVDLPMTPGDELYIRILSVDPNYRSSAVIGFTNAHPSAFTEHFDKLPAGDVMALYDRSEYWIVNEDVFDERLKELDEYCFTYEKQGDIQMKRNNELKPPKTVACADPSQTFYPFFFLNGRIAAFSLIGVVSPMNKTLQKTSSKKEDDENVGLCQICFDAKANCVFVQCGHIFFCSGCRKSYESSGLAKTCPICRKAYTDVFEIADD